MNKNMVPPQMGEWKKSSEVVLKDGVVYYASMMSGRSWCIDFVRAKWNESTQTMELRTPTTVPGCYYKVGDFDWFAKTKGTIPKSILQWMSPRE